MTRSRHFVSYRTYALAFAVVLSPVLLHLNSCGNSHLSALEIEADSLNRVIGFGVQTHAYKIWTDGADTIVVRATSAEPSAGVAWRLFIDGVFQDFQQLGTGGGETTLTIPPDTPSELQVDVNHNGELGRYTVEINPLCVADECDDANQCTSDVCNGSVCEFTAATGGTTLIEFDDGVEDDPVESFYEAQGVTFSPNTLWLPNFVDVIYGGGGDATPPMSISVFSVKPSFDNPIVATFCEPQSSVSILAVNVGQAGARLDAYDAEAGGSLVGFAEAFGTTSLGEVQNLLPGQSCATHPQQCWHEERLLSVSASSIRRIEVYRALDLSIDGVHFDNLTFEPASGP